MYQRARGVTLLAQHPLHLVPLTTGGERRHCLISRVPLGAGTDIFEYLGDQPQHVRRVLAANVVGNGAGERRVLRQQALQGPGIAGLPGLKDDGSDHASIIEAWFSTRQTQW